MTEDDFYTVLYTPSSNTVSAAIKTFELLFSEHQKLVDRVEKLEAAIMGKEAGE